MNLKHELRKRIWAGLALAWVGGLALIQTHAQIPNSLAGISVVSRVFSGVSPFASTGYFLMVPDDSGSAYNLVGYRGVVTSQGTYTYALTNENQAVLTMADSVVGSIVDLSTFTNSRLGTYHSTAPATAAAHQEGAFELLPGQAPDSVAGLGFIATAEDGAYPFGSGGDFTFAATTGTNYTILGNGLNGSNRHGSHGTYTYSRMNRSTVALQLSDSMSGGAVMYLSFSNASGGLYIVNGSSGFQIGHFLPLGFLHQPLDQIVHVGGAATFSLTAGGAEPMAYQWRLNGAAIPGATQPSYVWADAQLSDSGSQMSCVVSNLYGAISSRNAGLTVTTNRVVTLMAATLWTNTGVAVSPGQPVTLRAVAAWVWSGSVTNDLGPEGDPFDNANAYDLFYSQARHGALIAYTGPDPYQGHWGDAAFFPQSSGYWTIGSSNQVTSLAGGDLWLGYNDDATSEAVDDNEGYATIELMGVAPLNEIALRISEVSPTAITLSASGGNAGAPFRVLGASELRPPKSGWTPVASGTFDAGGNARIDLTRAPATARQFLFLASP